MSTKKRKIELQHPLEVDGTTLTAVTIRRPKYKHMRCFQADGDAGEQMGRLMADLTGLKPEVIDELDFEDAEAIAEAIGDFFPNGRPTGETPAPT